MEFDNNQRSYTSLRDVVSERTQRLVVWVGAGASAEANLPTWQALRDAPIKAGLDKARTLESPARAKLERLISNVMKENNLWLAFKLLKHDILGSATFHDEIRRALSEAPRAQIPDTYKWIWKLPLQGLLNLNIDRLATRAFYEKNGAASLIEFNGQQAGSMTGVSTGGRPFIANLHGDVENVNTWVFTQDDLSGLLKASAYQKCY